MRFRYRMRWILRETTSKVAKSAAGSKPSDTPEIGFQTYTISGSVLAISHP
jgi:hypothetical protein